MFTVFYILIIQYVVLYINFMTFSLKFSIKFSLKIFSGIFFEILMMRKFRGNLHLYLGHRGISMVVSSRNFLTFIQYLAA